MEKLGLSFRRIRILLIIFLIIAILLSIRIIYLTTVPIESYTFIGNSRNVVVKRGDIVDCNNRILAANDELYSIYANPEQISKNEINLVSSELANLLSINRDIIFQKLSSKKSFIWLKRQITPKEYEKVNELKLKGYDFEFTTMDFEDISSTQIRAGEIKNHVTQEVEEYIEKNGLYK